MDFNRNEFLFKAPALRDLFFQVKKVFQEVKTFPMNAVPNFIGVGVYAIEYLGNSRLYTELTFSGQKGEFSPIYVGKAVPPGWRTARHGEVKNDLTRRLREHGKSINAVSNLDITDFRARFLILEDEAVNLIGAIEADIINSTTPPWNSCIDGFGNHDPGSGRYEQAISPWDVLHPGRPWAERLRGKQRGPSYFEKCLSSFFAKDWK